MDFLLLKNVRNSSCCAHGELLGQPELKLDIIYLAVLHLSCGLQDFSLPHTDFPGVVHGIDCSKAWGILIHQPRMEPMSPALQGGVLTTGPRGKSLDIVFLFDFFPAL